MQELEKPRIVLDPDEAVKLAEELEAYAKKLRELFSQGLEEGYQWQPLIYVKKSAGIRKRVGCYIELPDSPDEAGWRTFDVLYEPGAEAYIRELSPEALKNREALGPKAGALVKLIDVLNQRECSLSIVALNRLRLSFQPTEPAEKQQQRIDDVLGPGGIVSWFLYVLQTPPPQREGWWDNHRCRNSR